MKRYSYHLRLLALAWAGVLLVGATACGDGDDPNETPEPPATQPVLIDGKFSSWNSTSADGIFDDGAAHRSLRRRGRIHGRCTALHQQCASHVEGGPVPKRSLTHAQTFGRYAGSYTPHADRMPLAGTTATVTAAADQSAAADFAAAISWPRRHSFQPTSREPCR